MAYSGGGCLRPCTQLGTTLFPTQHGQMKREDSFVLGQGWTARAGEWAA